MAQRSLIRLATIDLMTFSRIFLRESFCVVKFLVCGGVCEAEESVSRLRVMYFTRLAIGRLPAH